MKALDAERVFVIQWQERRRDIAGTTLPTELQQDLLDAFYPEFCAWRLDMIQQLLAAFRR